jgi:hypothetical protein
VELLPVTAFSQTSNEGALVKQTDVARATVSGPALVLLPVGHLSQMPACQVLSRVRWEISMVACSDMIVEESSDEFFEWDWLTPDS